MASQTDTAGDRQEDAAAISRICHIAADTSINSKQVNTLLTELKLPTTASLNDRRQQLKEACSLIKETGRLSAPAERLAAPTRQLRRSSSLKATEQPTTAQATLRRTASLDGQEPAGPTKETTKNTTAQVPPTHTENTGPAAPSVTEVQAAAPAAPAPEPHSTGAAPEAQPKTTEPPTHEAPNTDAETTDPADEGKDTAETSAETWGIVKAAVLENARRPVADSSCNAANNAQIVVTRILTTTRAHTLPHGITKRLVNYDEDWTDAVKSMSNGDAITYDPRPTTQPTGTNHQEDASKANAEQQLLEALRESRYTAERHATTVCAACNASTTRTSAHATVQYDKSEWPSQKTGLAITPGTQCDGCCSPHTTTVVAITPSKQGGIIVLTGENLPSNLTWGPHTATLAAGLAKTANKRQSGETWTAVTRDLDGRSEWSSTSKISLPRTTEKMIVAIYNINKISEAPSPLVTTDRISNAQSNTRPTYANATKARITATARPTAAKTHGAINPATATPAHHTKAPKAPTKRRVCITSLDIRWTAKTLLDALRAERVDLFDTFAVATMPTASIALDLTGGGNGAWHRFANGRGSFITYDRPWARQGKIVFEQAHADHTQGQQRQQQRRPQQAQQQHPPARPQKPSAQEPRPTAQQQPAHTRPTPTPPHHHQQQEPPATNAQPKPTKPVQDDTKAAILTALAEVLPTALAAFMAQHDALRATTQKMQLQQQAVQFMYPDPLGFPQQPLGAATPAGLVAPTRS